MKFHTCSNQMYRMGINYDYGLQNIHRARVFFFLAM